VHRPAITLSGTIEMFPEVLRLRTRLPAPMRFADLRAIAIGGIVFTALFLIRWNPNLNAAAPPAGTSSTESLKPDANPEADNSSDAGVDTGQNRIRPGSQPDDIISANPSQLWEARSLLDRALDAQHHSTLGDARELAEDAVRRVLEIRDNRAYEYGVCLAVLGSIDSESYRLADAAKECEAARSIIERFDDEPNLIHVLMNLAWVKRQQGSGEAASILYNDILSRLKDESHENGTEYFMVTLCLGHLSLDRNDIKGAKQRFDDAQERLSANLSENGSCITAMDAAWGRYHLLRKEYSDAERCLYHAFERTKLSSDVGGDKILEISTDYAESLIFQAKCDDARAVLVDALSRTEKNLGADHKEVRAARERIAALSPSK
jgi:tetratricopeptide (TPR) repeat protein